MQDFYQIQHHMKTDSSRQRTYKHIQRSVCTILSIYKRFSV